jgi:tRNA pseudouridine55 synthase
VLEITLPEVTFEVDCSSGTYVRAIARDVGDALGTGGHLSALRRTAVGPFLVADAAPLDALDAARAIPMLEAVAHLPRLSISEAEERTLRYGQVLAHTAVPGTCALERDGRLVAIAVADGERVKPKKVFPVE